MAKFTVAAIAFATVSMVSAVDWTCVVNNVPSNEGGDGGGGMDSDTCFGAGKSEDVCKACCEKSDICNAFARVTADGTCYYKKDYDTNREVNIARDNVDFCSYSKSDTGTPSPTGPKYSGFWNCADGKTPKGEGGNPTTGFKVKDSGNTRVECAQACDDEKDCNGFAFLNQDSWKPKGACFFKTAAGFDTSSWNDNGIYDFCYKDSTCTSKGQNNDHGDGCFKLGAKPPATPSPTASPVSTMLYHCQENRLPEVEGTGGIAGYRPGLTREGCEDACTANAKGGCNAFAFNKAGSGECWLKIGFVAADADYKKTNEFDWCYHIADATSSASQQECFNGKIPPYEGIATKGGFGVSDNMEVSRWGCAELCSKNPDCNAFAWAVDKSECHLKSKYTHTVTDLDKWIERDDMDFCFDPFRPHSLEHGFECRDGSLPSWEGEGVANPGEKGSESAEQCVIACKDNAECTSMVYNKWSKKCYFKKWFDVTNSDITWKGNENDAWEHEYFYCYMVSTAGNYDCTDKKVPQIEGIPVTKETYSGLSRNECQRACDAYDDCNAFAFARDTGVCHLKQKFGAADQGDKTKWDANAETDFCFNPKRPYADGAGTMTCKDGQLPASEGNGLVGGDAFNGDKAACKAACIADATCNAIVYDVAAGNCYFKSGFDAKNADWETKKDVKGFDFCYVAATTSNAGDFTCAQRKVPPVEGIGIVKAIGATTRYGCAESCSSDAECNAFVWNRAGDNCFLKKKFSVAHMGPQSSWKVNNGTDFCWDPENGVAPPTVSMSLHCMDKMIPGVEGEGTTDANGEANGDFEGLTRPECAEKCSLNSQCNAFAWARDGGGCHLKKGFNTAAQHGWATNENYDFCYSTGNTDSVEKILAALRIIGEMKNSGMGIPTTAKPAACTANPESCNPEVMSDGVDATIKAPFGSVAIDTQECGQVDLCAIYKVIDALSTL